MLDQENFSMIQSQSRLEQEQKDLETLLSTFGENEENQQDLNFSQDYPAMLFKKKVFRNEEVTTIILK